MKTTIEEIVEVEIERPPSEVWSVINDTARLPEWIAEFASARDESDGPAGVGAVVHTSSTGCAGSDARQRRR